MFLLPLVLGFCISLVAVSLPGLINMTAAKINLQEGKSQAISFGFGASLVVFIQTYIAILFARFINNHQEVISILQKMGIVIFATLSFYFFWFAKKPKKINAEIKVKGKTNRFFLGILLSLLNFLPIPFYVFTSITLVGLKYFTFQKLPILLFVLGVVLGSFTIFYLYIISSFKIQEKTDFLIKNINNIIGFVTAFITLITIYKLFVF